MLHELHSLLRVMWSGKMSTVVSPHNMLYTVWNNIPFFRGYSQQDAQEFLSYAVFTFSILKLILKTPIPDVTYNVFGGTLSLPYSINLFLDLNFHSRFLRVVNVVSEIVFI